MRPLRAALLALALVACGRESTRTLDWPAVRLDVPSAWREEPGVEGRLLRPVTDGAPVSGAFVLLASDPPAQGTQPDLAQYVAHREGWAGAAWEKMTVTARAPAHVGTLPAERREWRVEGRQGVRRMLALLWVDAAGGHALIASAPEAQFQPLRGAFERLLDSARPA